jgi:predicted lysophospholipase L1 biosynthesis ABC-type transport system permease subunit
MTDKKYLDDISEIKNLMNRSSQFLSLSGLSGILAGIYALVGAWLAHYMLTAYETAKYYEIAQNSAGITERELVNTLLLIAVVVIGLSLATGVILSSGKAAKAGEKLWNHTSRRLVANFAFPLATGGTFTLLLLREGEYYLLAPAMLMFYGLACFSAGKYTFRDVRYLGVTLVLLGLIATAFPGYWLLIWALGFGVCHIVYGTIMYFKYDRKP